MGEKLIAFFQNFQFTNNEKVLLGGCIGLLVSLLMALVITSRNPKQ